VTLLVDIVDDCEVCGSPARFDRIDITTWGDSQPVYVKGMKRCPTRRCGEVCPICRREPGDVHMAECAPIVLAKLERQAFVSREDCRVPLLRC
jgi:hypothetical protein